MATHHFFPVDRKTPVGFDNHGAKRHILWMSALILKQEHPVMLRIRPDQP